MLTITILMVLGVALYGAIYVVNSKYGHNQTDNRDPPSLPARASRTSAQPENILQRKKVQKSAEVHPQLPHRRFQSVAKNHTLEAKASYYGPRGLKPSQFPCCPFDKQRNVPGGRQVIFWDEQAHCYYCSRGHRFRSNGKPI